MEHINLDRFGNLIRLDCNNKSSESIIIVVREDTPVKFFSSEIAVTRALHIEMNLDTLQMTSYLFL